MKNDKNAVVQKIQPQYQIEIWPSLLRIIATFGIFVYHYLGLLDYSTFRIDFYSILIFCFLSGYFSVYLKKNPERWLVKRYFGIMIPYWLVILPILLLNRIENYKKTTLMQDIGTFLGGNMFLENPVYVIAWYITFILILYLFNYLLFKTHGAWKIIFGIIGFVFFIKIGKVYYFLIYIIGMAVNHIKSINITNNYKNLKVVAFLFEIQKYCYCFFLVHGGILLFFLTKISSHNLFKFIFSFATSSILSFFLFQISQKIIIATTKKTFALIPKKPQISL